ncbi:MAG TPA: fused MFS/spermidine synthase [Gemmatimonadaceae bacterium]|nr:fused MFS/spermidine synthase [Gemmatimonadaceae bacterium]
MPTQSFAVLRDRGARFAAAIFLSSGLLFLLEPIAGKRLLPLLGGSAAVWTACLVFFQLALLLGYLLAHWLVMHASARAQVSAYGALLLLSIVQLALTTTMPLEAAPLHPVASVLWMLTAIIGVPFVTLSATSSLLQAWYARTSAAAHDAGAHPYRLYAVSNIGSLLALVIYPWWIEPEFPLRGQQKALGIGVVLLGVAVATIAPDVMRAAGAPAVGSATPGAPVGVARSEGIGRRLLWVLLAACGSLLLSAVTIHLSQNVATIPLLWIIPLVAYLLSFVVAFGSERWRPRGLTIALAIAGLASAGWVLYKGDLFMAVPRVVAVFCFALFAICTFCHSELYRTRPAASRLTTFYFCLAAGGALGATVVGVLAPAVLSGTYELAFGLCLAAVLALAATWDLGWIARDFWAAATVVLASLIVGEVRADRHDAIARERNFYGTLHVTQYYDRSFAAPVRTLYNGIIEHGQQVFRADLQHMPTTYYGPPSGIGLAVERCCGTRARRIGVIGLGTGTLAAYARAGDTVRFYDINPAVEPIARRYFSYLQDARMRGAQVDVVTGDARISLEHESPQRFDVIAVDAFSGDAIPVHLITSEALALYRRHLRRGGIVAFHVSNRYLDLPPVVAELAAHAHMYSALVTTQDDDSRDLFGSDWVLVSDDSAFFSLPDVRRAARPVRVRRGLRLWTDDYNSLLPILRMHSRSTAG